MHNQSEKLQEVSKSNVNNLSLVLLFQFFNAQLNKDLSMALFAKLLLKENEQTPFFIVKFCFKQISFFFTFDLNKKKKEFLSKDRLDYRIELYLFSIKFNISFKFHQEGQELKIYLFVLDLTSSFPKELKKPEAKEESKKKEQLNVNFFLLNFIKIILKILGLALNEYFFLNLLFSFLELKFSLNKEVILIFKFNNQCLSIILYSLKKEKFGSISSQVNLYSELQ